MTKQHFEAAAAIVRSYREKAKALEADTQMMAAQDMLRLASYSEHAYITLFSAFNPLFDSARFHEACFP